VLREYLKGKTRNEIARCIGLGAGTVTIVIQEWREKVAGYEPEKIRDLAVELRKTGLTADDCVRHTRVINKMRDLDLDEDNFLKVMERIQVKSIEKGVPPEKCGDLITQLFNISQVEKIPLDEVPNQLREKLKEIEALKAQLTANNVTAENINSYISLKDSLTAIGLPDMDIDSVLNLIRSFKAQGFDANRIVRMASSIIPLEDRAEVFRNQLLHIRNSISNWEYLVPLLQAVKDVGAGTVAPSGLRMLFECINYRAATDHISSEVAAQRIMMDIEQLHKIVGFEREMQAKQLQIRSLEDKREELNEFWTKDLQAIDALLYLNKQRVAKEHILVFTNFFRGNQNKINLATFLADLKNYGSLKGALGVLEEEIEIRKEQREYLENYNSSQNQEIIHSRRTLFATRKELDSTRNELQRLIAGRKPVRAEIAVAAAKEKDRGKTQISTHPTIKTEGKTITEVTGRKEAANNGIGKESSPINNPESRVTATTTITTTKSTGQVRVINKQNENLSLPKGTIIKSFSSSSKTSPAAEKDENCDG
jgi:hypothetical protein